MKVFNYSIVPNIDNKTVKKIKSPERDPHFYNNLIFTKYIGGKVFSFK